MFMLMFCIILIIVSLVVRTSCCTCAPSFVGVASPVSEIVLIFACLQNRQNFPLDPWTIVHGHQKFNRLESAQKIYTSRD